MQQDHPVYPGLEDVVGGANELNSSQIHVIIRQPPIIGDDPDARKAANEQKQKQKYTCDVRTLIVTVNFTILIIILAILIYGIVSFKIINNKVENLQSSTIDKNTLIDTIADLSKSRAVLNGTMKCGNWDSNFQYLNKYPCSGCSGSILNAQCLLCTTMNYNSYNNDITGSSCSGCNLTESSNGYCSYCSICSIVNIPLICFSLSTYTHQKLIVNANSCTGCSGNVCALCNDMMDSDKKADNCSYCITVSSGRGFCNICQRCIF